MYTVTADVEELESLRGESYPSDMMSKSDFPMRYSRA